MCRAEAVVPAALVRAKEKVDAQELEESEARDEEVDVGVESVSLGTEDLRRHKKNLMQKWRITGARKRMALMVLMVLGWPLRLISRWWNKSTSVDSVCI
jgi:hypothetical protein